jgi:hypothetical protein
MYDRHFNTRKQDKAAMPDWLAFCNSTRLHSTLGYVSPMQFEKKLAGRTGKIFYLIVNIILFSKYTLSKHLCNFDNQTLLTSNSIALTQFEKNIAGIDMIIMGSASYGLGKT